MVFFRKCHQICRKLNNLMKNFIFLRNEANDKIDLKTRKLFYKSKRFQKFQKWSGSYDITRKAYFFLPLETTLTKPVDCWAKLDIMFFYSSWQLKYILSK